MELSAGTPDRYKKITFWKQAIDELLMQVFVEAYVTALEQSVLDIDTTDVALHGDREGRFFHRYYDHYCNLPLYVFCGEHLLCARQRPANIDAAAGCLDEIRRIVAQIHEHCPEVRIVLRGDSGFCRDELLRWCQDNRVDYVVGLARNKRLRALVAKAEHIDGKENPRFVVTSVAAQDWPSQRLYEDLYCPSAMWRTALRNSSSYVLVCAAWV